MFDFELDFEKGSLSEDETEKRDEIIKRGINVCKEFISKQKSIEDYFFYEGSIEGFEECKKFSKFSDFERRIEQLYIEETRELSKSWIKDEMLREYLKIFNKNEKTDYNTVFKLKGKRTQIQFVYDKLKAYRLVSLILSKKT